MKATHFTFLSAVLALVLAAFPEPVLAQTIWDRVAYVGGSLGGFSVFDFSNPGDVFRFILGSLKPLGSFIAIVYITRAGFALASRQSDEQMTAAKRTIGASVLALVLINIAGPLGNALGTVVVGSDTAGEAISTEVLGFLNFIEQAVALVAVLTIIYNGIRAVLDFGSGQGTTHLRRAVAGVVVGIVLILVKVAVTTAVVGDPYEIRVPRRPDGFLAIIVNVVNFILGFGALVATVVIIFAGLMMIFNIGKDEQYQKAKSLLLRVIIGLVVIIASMAIINLVLLV